MKIPMLRPIRYWLLALCCVLLSTARAQEVQPPATDKAPPISAPAETHADAPGGDDEQHDDDDWATPPSTESDHRENRRHKRSHRHNDDVVGIGYSVELPEGQRASDVVAIFGTATSAGDVDSSVVSVLGHTHVTGHVGDSAVGVMGSVYVNGNVDQDVVAVLGNVELGPEARVRGDVVVVGGVLTRDPSSRVDGHVQTIVGGDAHSFGWLRTWIERCLLYGRPLAFASGLGWAWTVALGLLALYVFLALIFTRGVDQCVATLETQPGQSALAALVTLLLTPITFVLLCVTVLGILAIPFLGLALLCAMLFGKVVVLATIGRRCTPFLADKPQQHTVMSVLIGGLIVLVLYTIPVVGLILWKLIEILGLGVVVYTILLAVKASRAAHRGGGGQPGGSGDMYAGAASGAGGTGWVNGGAGGGVGSPGMPGSDPGGGSPGTGSGVDGVGGVGSAGAAGGVGGVGSAGAAAGVGDVGSPGAAGDVGGVGSAGAMGGIAGGGSADAAGVGSAGGGGTFAGGGSPGAGPAPGAFASSSDNGASAGWSAGGPAASNRGTAPGASVGPTPGGPGPAAAGHAPYVNPLSFPRAGFWIRMGALLLDAILVGIVVHPVSRGFDPNLILLATYGAVMWKLKSATVGGIICGLQVVRLDGRPIDWPTAIVRALGCFLSLAVVGLGFLWIVIDDNKQSWHDKIAGTVVVRSPKNVSLL
jgi:uncharacterized RDD family membrane protein YckC